MDSVALGVSVWSVVSYPVTWLSEQFGMLSTEQSMRLFYLLAGAMSVLFAVLCVGSILYVSQDAIIDLAHRIADHIDETRDATKDTGEIEVSDTNDLGRKD